VSKLHDFEGLAIFAKVLQTRSFVGAAAELRLLRGTVSKAVGRIEKKFGARLFNSSSRRLALTEDGRQLDDRAAHILAEGEAAENEGVAQAALPHGDILPAAPVSFGVLCIAPRFAGVPRSLSGGQHRPSSRRRMLTLSVKDTTRQSTLPPFGIRR
jgi:DNA-binding transcriptional LysR family regulator